MYWLRAHAYPACPWWITAFPLHVNSMHVANLATDDMAANSIMDCNCCFCLCISGLQETSKQAPNRTRPSRNGQLQSGSYSALGPNQRMANCALELASTSVMLPKHFWAWVAVLLMTTCWYALQAHGWRCAYALFGIVKCVCVFALHQLLYVITGSFCCS